MVATFILLALGASPAARITNAEARAVKTYIEGRAKERAHGRDDVNEFEGGRKVLRGDLDEDGTADLVVLFTLEEGNMWTQFLAVLGGPGNRPLAILRVGGKGQRTVELTQVGKGRIDLSTKHYGPTDALCCPSLVGHSVFVLRSNVLEEAATMIDAGKG